MTEITEIIWLGLITLSAAVTLFAILAIVVSRDTAADPVSHKQLTAFSESRGAARSGKSAIFGRGSVWSRKGRSAPCGAPVIAEEVLDKPK